jgi:hypothetical protein
MDGKPEERASESLCRADESPERSMARLTVALPMIGIEALLTNRKVSPWQKRNKQWD